MLELMGMDDVVAGGEKRREGKNGQKGGWGVDERMREAPPRGPWNPSGPHSQLKGHRPPEPYILLTKEPSL